MTTLLCVDPVYASRIWPIAEKYITRAVKRTNLADAAVIAAKVAAGQSLLWLATTETSITGAGTTELTVANGRKCCEITAFGGDDHKVWLHLVGIIEKYAKDEGCAAVRLMGRRGWKRLLKDYAVTSVVMERRL